MARSSQHPRHDTPQMMHRSALENDNERFFNSQKDNFNCYAYAVDDRSNPSDVIGSVPGAAAGEPMTKLTAADLSAALVCDGAVAVAPLPGPGGPGISPLPPHRQGYRLIAAFISMEGQGDFHFYRQDNTGLWSHKPAHSEVQYKDSRGNEIIDPRFAARDYRDVLINGLKWPLNYQVFAGFFYVPERGLKTAHAPPPVLVHSHRASR